MTTNYGGTADEASRLRSAFRRPQPRSAAAAPVGRPSTSATPLACAATSGGVSIITNALANNGNVGIGEYYTGGNAYFSTYGIASGSRNSHILITYSGGTDADAPTPDFVPYTGIDSYIEGERTFFITLNDMSGIDTTSSGAQFCTTPPTVVRLEQHHLRIGFQQPIDAGELVPSAPVRPHRPTAGSRHERPLCPTATTSSTTGSSKTSTRAATAPTLATSQP